ncbi:MAG: LptE family protein [Bacteroidota bacterium]
MRSSITTGFFSLYGVFALTLLLPVLVFTGSCRMSYSFTGASISPEVKTISINNFPNKAMLVVPTLSRNLTEALQNYFTSQTNLILVDRNGDLTLEGSITGYAVQPQAISGNEVAQLNRLTITVQVKFTNKFDEKQNFESNFSRYLDYPSSQNLISVQDNLIAEINDQLVQDIFNKAVVNW